MTLRHLLRRPLVAASLAAALLTLQPAKAVEYGLSQYFLGLTIPLCGYVPPQGLYYFDTLLLFNGSLNTFKGSFAVDIIETGAFFDTDINGATVGLVATIPYLSNHSSQGLAHTPGAESGAIADLGDTDYSAVIGWHAGNHNWLFAFTGFAPTGNYSAPRLVQTSFNRAAIDLKAAYTYLDETGTEASAALGVTYNALNSATDYQSGAELHFEWALNQHFASGLAAGIGGYVYQQLTADSGLGDVNGAFIGRVASIGPLLSYAFQDGKQQVNLSARWFHEFAAKNRVSGDSIFASIGLKF